MAKKIGQAYLEREQSRFFRPGGGALGRDDEKSQSSDDVEDLDADMGRPGVPAGHVVDYSVFIHTSFDCCILRGITDTFQDSIRINNWIYITSGWFQMALIQINYFCGVNLVLSPIYRSSNLEI